MTSFYISILSKRKICKAFNPPVKKIVQRNMIKDSSKLKKQISESALSI